MDTDRIGRFPLEFRALHCLSIQNSLILVPHFGHSISIGAPIAMNISFTCLAFRSLGRERMKYCLQGVCLILKVFPLLNLCFHLSSIPLRRKRFPSTYVHISDRLSPALLQSPCYRFLLARSFFHSMNSSAVISESVFNVLSSAA